MADPLETPQISSQVLAERTHLVIPSLPNWIEPTVEFLRQKAVLGGACQETRSGKLLIALHEAITNAVIHGNLELSSELKEKGDGAFAEAMAQRSADPAMANRKVDIVADFDGDMCRWVITDQGRGFDVARVLARCLSDDPEILLSSGRGILMMKSFLDEVRYDLGGRRVILGLARNSGEERRRDHRVPMMTPFQVTPLAADGTPHWGETYEAVSRNFSERGMSLLQQQLAHSAQVLIGVQTDHGLVQIPAAIRHSRRLGDHGMELGCEFTEPLEHGNPIPDPPPPAAPQLEAVRDIVTRILERHQSSQVPTHERRIHPRIIFNERVTIYGEPNAEPVVGFARDLSKGGIALIAHKMLPSEVTIAFAAQGDHPPLKVRCKICRCNRIQKGFYDVGASFLRMDDKMNG